ncbi:MULTISPECIES: short-chain dehydrogenase/reductase [Thermomonosporaceae]|uniref:short-chain dehydrogenase/reductase n=1 Tax=Thermomonosporaceae TaxID=2012 RepID=UPI00255A74F1|nr:MULTISPECIES: short-chain dehydrogenase/reductase [Thermomonosporaceae]MDL4770683.1 short-chain dehydrogenase/reductase [Actinomadura xylanilytica]
MATSRTDGKSPLTGRVIVISGAGRGIGLATARRLIGTGARVVLLDRDAGVHEAAAGLGDRAAAFTVDVTDAGAMTAVMDEVAARHGGIDAVVANAGISGPNATVESVDPAAFERVVEVNLLGVWRTVRAALPHVRARRGYILMTSSIAAAIPCPTVAGYAASKAGIEAFGRALRIELAHTGTQVGIAYFGAVDTELVRGLITRPALREGLEKMPRRLGAPIPVDRAGAAMAGGVERRARTVYAPWWVPALLAVRAQLAMADPLAARIPALARLIEDTGKPG